MRGILMTKRILCLILISFSQFGFSEPDCNAFPVFTQDMELATPKNFLYRYFSSYPFKRISLESNLPAVQGLIRDHSEINRVVHIRMPLNVIFGNLQHSGVADLYIGLIKGDYWNAAIVLPDSISLEERQNLFASMDPRFESESEFEVGCTYYVFGLSGQMRLYVDPAKMVIHASRTIIQLDIPSN
jgi:hypothetical protein